jgi:hypothetical protein
MQYLVPKFWDEESLWLIGVTLRTHVENKLKIPAHNQHPVICLYSQYSARVKSHYEMVIDIYTSCRLLFWNITDTSSLFPSITHSHYHKTRQITINMVAVSNNIRDGWISIPFSGGARDQTPAPAYSYTAAANHFATPQYDAQTSLATAAAASRRSPSPRYTLPTSLPSVIEMQDLGAGAATCDSQTETPQTSTSPTNASQSDTADVLPTPATQPKKQHGAAYRTASFVLKTVVLAIGIVAIGVLIYGLIYGIYELFVLIFFR